MATKTDRIPKKAFQFDMGQNTQFDFREGTDGKKSLKITPLYSGGKVNHWYWGDVVIDVNSLKFSGKKFPVLRDHDQSKIIGFSSKPKIIESENGLQGVHLEDITVMDTEFADEVVNYGRQGFPYQASISIRPTKVTRLSEGDEMIVNGQVVKGPVAIWKDCHYREGSVCVFGVDSNTQSQVFQDSDKETFSYIEERLTKEETVMPFDPANFSDDAEFKAFVSKVQAEASAGFSDKISELEAKVKDKEKDIAKLGEEKTGLVTRLDTLEAFAAKVTERETASEAKSIINKELGEYSFSPRIQEKISGHIHYDHFVNDNKLDKAAFAEHVKKEVADWAETIAPADSPVQGGGGSFKKAAAPAENFSDKDGEELAASMLKDLGITQ